MQNRSMLKLFLLTIVTLGIYQLFWTYWTRQELVAKGQDVPRFSMLFSPLLAILAVILLVFINSFVFSQTSGGGGLAVINVIAVVVGVVAFMAFIPITLWWYFKYCKALPAVTGGKLTFDLSYVLFLVTAFFGVSYVWPFIVQYHFNESGGLPDIASKAPVAPGGPAAPTAI